MAATSGRTMEVRLVLERDASEVRRCLMMKFPQVSRSISEARLARCLCCIALLCAPGAASAQISGQDDADHLPDVFSGPLFHETGKAHVLEGDHLVVNDTVMSLYGVEAPLRIQPCIKDGEPFGCGFEAKDTLESLIEGKVVTCDQVRDSSFRRRALTFARCTVEGTDVAAEMVRKGMAMAFPEQSDDYIDLEAEAKADSTGLWSADWFEKPWAWEAEQKMR